MFLTAKKVYHIIEGLSNLHLNCLPRVVRLIKTNQVLTDRANVCYRKDQVF